MGHVFVATSYHSADQIPSGHAHPWRDYHRDIDRDDYTEFYKMKGRIFALVIVVLSVIIVIIASSVLGGLGHKLVNQSGPGPLRFMEYETLIPLDARHLSVQIPWGAITITGKGKPGEVSVRAIVQHDPDRRNEHQSSLENFLSIDATAIRTEIKDANPERLSLLGSWRRKVLPLSLFLKIPDDTVVYVESSQGRIQLSRFDGEIHVFSDQAQIGIRELKGNLVVQTNSGNIHVEEAFIDEEINIRSREGAVYFSGTLGTKTLIETGRSPITLAISRSGSYEIVVDQGLGTFESQLPIVNGRLGQGAPRGVLHVMTGSGSIHLEGL